MRALTLLSAALLFSACGGETFEDYLEEVRSEADSIESLARDHEDDVLDDTDLHDILDFEDDYLIDASEHQTMLVRITGDMLRCRWTGPGERPDSLPALREAVDDLGAELSEHHRLMNESRTVADAHEEEIVHQDTLSDILRDLRAERALLRDVEQDFDCDV